MNVNLLRGKKNIRVLLVDDNTLDLEFTELMLKEYDSGFNIDTTTSPSQAYEMATNSEYDCIVTDYRMPNINGLELVKMIRERSDIPIIMFTGYGNELVAAAGIEAGLNGYMRKNSDPSVYSDLASMIRRLVEARRDHPSSTIHT